MLYKPIGNDVMFEGSIYVKQGGEYRQMPYRLPRKGYCDFAATDIYYYQDMAKNSDLPEDVRANCPLQPGRYNFHNVVLKLDKFPKAIAKSGDYITDAKYFMDDMLILHHQIYVKIINIV
jgi:hypothetical protein